METAVEPSVAPVRFPGWTVVAGCFIILTTSSGLGFYGLAVYLNAFSNEQGWPLKTISLATTLFFIVGGVVGVAVARVIARFDVRYVIVGGGVIGGVSLAALGQVEEQWQLFVVYAVFGVAFAAAGLVPATTVVTRWFHERRSVALSVASTGLSVGGILITPFAKRLIDDRGLAAATPWLGLVFVVGIVPFAWFMIRPDPAAEGWNPDGKRIVVGRRADRPERMVLRARRADPVLHRGHHRVHLRPRLAGRWHPAAGQARGGSDRPQHRPVRDHRPGGDVGRRPSGRRPHRAARADDAVHGRARRAAMRGARPAGLRRIDVAHLHRDRPVRHDDRQHPDAPAAAHRRTVRGA